MDGRPLLSLGRTHAPLLDAWDICRMRVVSRRMRKLVRRHVRDACALLEAIAARHLPAPRLRLPPIQANDAATATSASLLGNTTNGAVGLDDPGLLETLFPLKPSGAEDLPSDVDREHPAEALQDEEAGHGGLVLQHHMSPNRVLQQSVSAEVAAASDKVSCCVLGGCDVAACERGLSGEGRRGWGGSSAR